MMIAEVIQRARRRLLWIEIASQGSYAICAALGAVLLLLLLGSQGLDWRWLAALPAAVLAAGAWRTLSRVPGHYATAQLVDRRLKLSDSLSTAVFFSRPELPERGSEAARETQRSQAMRLCENVNPAEAIPFQAPRAIFPAGALALLCVSLFALRYGIEHRLDLRPSLAQMLKHNFDAAELRAQELRKQGQQKDQADKRSGPKDPAKSAMQDAASDKSRSMEAAKSAADSPQANGRADEREQADAQREGDLQSRDGEQSSTEGLSPSQRRGEQQSAGEAGEKEGLLSKMQDAMQNLLSSMKQQLGGSARRQQGAANRDSESTNQQGRGRNMQSSQDKQGAGRESASQEGQQATEAKGGQARGAGQGTDQQKGDQPGSASGNQDGNKDLQLAERSAAAGQISPISGQRSPEATGNMTVEVQSGNQQLRTAYTQKNVEHTNAAEGINRDEVPLLYQSYVQQYFEEIRKERSPAAARPGARPLSR